jgi:serine protease
VLSGPDGTAADLDLYVRFGDAASTTAYDCGSYTRESTETCRFDAPATGTWYVMIHAGTGGAERS